MKRMKTKKLRFLEFLIVGLVMGIAEDLLAVFVATDAELNAKVFWIVVIVAIPFAFISEVIVDHPRFWSVVLRPFSKKNKSRE